MSNETKKSNALLSMSGTPSNAVAQARNLGATPNSPPTHPSLPPARGDPEVCKVGQQLSILTQPHQQGPSEPTWKSLPQ